jgi:hypothetical protein
VSCENTALPIEAIDVSFFKEGAKYQGMRLDITNSTEVSALVNKLKGGSLFCIEYIWFNTANGKRFVIQGKIAWQVED